MAGGIEAIAATIGVDLQRRLPGQNKKQREGLALLTATMLDVRSANLMDVAASLPRDAERLDMRYQWISQATGQRADQHRRGDGALCIGAASAYLRRRTADYSDHRPDAGERYSAGDCRCRTRRRSFLADRMAGQGNSRSDWISGAESRTRSRACVVARRREGGADGRSLLRQTGPDRVVQKAWLGLAFAA